MLIKYKPFEWMLIEAANHIFDLDKDLYEKRIQWARDNLDNLEDFIEQADSKPMFAKAILAIRDVQAGKPTGAICRLDSAASGIQLLSVMTRCVVGMVNTGVIDSGKRPDIYRTLTELMNMMDMFSRKKVKLAFMT